MEFVWLGLVVLFIIVEALTVGITSIWFAAGSLVAFLLACLHLPFWLQLVAFIVVSVVLLILTKPLAQKYARGKKATNFDLIIGRDGIVTQMIDNLEAKGQIKVLGQEWTARSEDGEVIPVGTKVSITRVEGVKAFVEKVIQ